MLGLSWQLLLRPSPRLSDPRPFGWLGWELLQWDAAVVEVLQFRVEYGGQLPEQVVVRGLLALRGPAF